MFVCENPRLGSIRGGGVGALLLALLRAQSWADTHKPKPKGVGGWPIGQARPRGG